MDQTNLVLLVTEDLSEWEVLEICKIQDAYSLPSWNDSSDMAARFCQWFNESARHKWNDHKNRTLRRTYDLCKGDVTQASSHQPSTVDASTWTSLLSTYNQKHSVDESGFSKSAKCKASRSCNELDHRLGRESLGSWKGKFRRSRGREPGDVEIFSKEFTKQDPLLASPGNLPPPHMRGKPVSERTFEIGEQFKRAYEAALASGSDESTATAQAAVTTFGRVQARLKALQRQEACDILGEMPTLFSSRSTLFSSSSSDRRIRRELPVWRPRLKS